MKIKNSCLFGSSFAVLALFAGGMASVSAQTLNTVSGDQQINGGSGGTNPQPNLKITGTGGVVFGGTAGQGSIPAQGSGVRMMWYPNKGAFRAGLASATSWQDAQIGTESFAAGSGTTASGYYSFAVGSLTQATGSYSSAFGEVSMATGTASTALGESFAEGDYTFAVGMGDAYGYDSTALGEGFAVGFAATTIGWAEADADFSTASGENVYAEAFGSTVLGGSNVVPADQNPTLWQANDELLVVGNGQMSMTGTPGEPNYASDALVLRKNANLRTAGQIEAKGVIRCAPGGDLSMGAFTAGQDPRTLNAGLRYPGE